MGSVEDGCKYSEIEFRFLVFFCFGSLMQNSGLQSRTMEVQVLPEVPTSKGEFMNRRLFLGWIGSAPLVPALPLSAPIVPCPLAVQLLEMLPKHSEIIVTFSHSHAIYDEPIDVYKIGNQYHGVWVFNYCMCDYELHSIGSASSVEALHKVAIDWITSYWDKQDTENELRLCAQQSGR